MVSGALYNEIDPKAAAWIRELIKQGHIAPGDVAECSIEDLSPNDIRPYAQFHAFAGVGVWSYSLRRAGWRDDRPAWSMSCPCQPFSAAGKGAGFADERHLWPYAYWLIEQCRPAVIFGEQVASKDAEPWLDLVQADLEALDYAVGAVPFPSAGIGAPHIRDRLYWVADAERADGRGEHWQRLGRAPGTGEGRAQEWQRLRPDFANGSAIDWLADALGERRRLGQSGGEDAADAAVAIEASGLADDDAQGRLEQPQLDGGSVTEREASEPRFDDDGCDNSGVLCATGPLKRTDESHCGAGPVNGLWRDADWLFCRDGKWRPVEPGTFPLAHGAPARVGRLRGYGNAINAEAAVAWIESYLDAEADLADRRRVRLGVFA